MDLVNIYRNAAYRDNFDFEFLWLEITNDEEKIEKFLYEKNKNLAMNVSIYIDDIRKVISELESIDEELTVKCSIHKCNLNVKPKTLTTGVNTKMVFVLRTMSGGNSSWYIYGFADCRMKNRSSLSFNKETELGFKCYVSLSEMSDPDSGTFDKRPSFLEELVRERKERERLHERT